MKQEGNPPGGMGTVEPLIEWGVAGLALDGQAESGDQHLIQPFANGLLMAVVDGLGHGLEAAQAAEIAVATLAESAHEPVVPLLQRCHEALKGTRGVVASLASFHAPSDTISWISVGNVEGLLLRAEADATGRAQEYVLPRGGVVGYRLPPLRPAVLSIRQGDLLIFATDGISDGFAKDLTRSDPPQQIADHILARYGKETDDALVLVARYRGGAA